MVRSIGNQFTVGNHIIRGKKPMVTVPQENVVNLTATNSIDMKECCFTLDICVDFMFPTKVDNVIVKICRELMI